MTLGVVWANVPALRPWDLQYGCEFDIIKHAELIIMLITSVIKTMLISSDKAVMFDAWLLPVLIPSQYGPVPLLILGPEVHKTC